MEHRDMNIRKTSMSYRKLNQEPLGHESIDLTTIFMVVRIVLIKYAN